MFDHPYVMEKLIQLDSERLDRIQHYERPVRPLRPNGILLAVGRTLRRAGEGMESWAAGDSRQSPVHRDMSCPHGNY